MKPIVTIVIPNYNGEKFVQRTAKSVLKNTQIPFELIVVDNNSTDKSLSILNKEFAQDKRLQIIKLKNNNGPTKAINVGVEKMRGRYLVVLGYDMEVDKEWLKQVVKYLDSHLAIGAGQLKILRMDRRNVFDSAGDKLTPFGFLTERAQEAEDKGQFDRVENIFSGKGTATIFRKEVYKKAGSFDNDYFMLWEEPDLFWRIWKLGKRVVFLPMTRTWHSYGTEEKKVSNKKIVMFIYLGCRNHILTMLKNGVGLIGFKMLLAVTLAWIGLFFLFLVRGKFKKCLAIIRAFGWIFANLGKIYKKRGGLKKKFGKKFYSDQYWFPKIIDKKRGFDWYIGKGIFYVLGKPF